MCQPVANPHVRLPRNPPERACAMGPTTIIGERATGVGNGVSNPLSSPHFLRHACENGDIRPRLTADERSLVAVQMQRSSPQSRYCTLLYVRSPATNCVTRNKVGADYWGMEYGEGRCVTNRTVHIIKNGACRLSYVNDKRTIKNVLKRGLYVVTPSSSQ